MMWFRVVGLIVVVIVIAAMGGWWLMRGQTGAAPAAALPEASKSGDAAAEKQTLPKIDKDALTLPGIIEPYESVPVSAKLTANIAAMKVRDRYSGREGRTALRARRYRPAAGYRRRQTGADAGSGNPPQIEGDPQRRPGAQAGGDGDRADRSGELPQRKRGADPAGGSGPQASTN